MGTGEWIYPALEALQRYKCQHEYLHETRMHHNDAIYQVYCGAHFEPIQVHLGFKRVSGTPAKHHTQTHEQLMLLNYKAAKLVRFKRFISIGGPALTL